MEAMQRAQVERERALAQKERALTDAQVAAQRMHVELMIALIERTTGGKPQDPITVLKQQLAFQKALDGTRNAGVLPPPAAGSDDEPAPAEKESSWLDKIQPFMPVAAMGAQQLVIDALAKNDPTKAEQMHRAAGSWARAFAAMEGAQSPEDALQAMLTGQAQ